jgi:predicted alpha/beta superfamily hydrolase
MAIKHDRPAARKRFIAVTVGSNKKRKMYKTVFLLILGFGIASCEKQEFDFQGSKTESSLYSNLIDDDFNIYTYLPANYNSNTDYPVVFLLDGNWYFEDFANQLSDLIQSGSIEPVILIGIGYKNSIGEKRFRDYTFPQDPEYDVENGQADRFSEFMKDQLIPEIESEYSTDSSQYILMGHSLGGLHTLYNMLTVNSPFSGYVAVSSSIWWSDGFLFGLEEQLFNDIEGLTARSYIAVGGDEPPSMTILNEEIVERLTARNYDGLMLESEFFTGASHSQVPMIGFVNGLQFVLNQ